MRAALEIEWCVPAYLPYVQPKLTAAAVKNAERRLGLKLPDSYIAALRVQNGGYLRYGIRGFAADELWGIGPRFPSILEGSLEERHGGEGWLPRGANALVPFVGDGHWYLCFDARERRAEPVITYVDIECERSRRAAKTFANLMARLGPDDDEQLIGLTTTFPTADVAQRLAKVLRLKVTDQGDWAHGYQTFLGRAKRRGVLVQFWVSPNEVPRGFIRADDADYAKLVGTLPGTALRYPEHPDCQLLVQVSELGLDELLAACVRVGLPAQRL